MPPNVRRLRQWFAVAALVIVAAVLGTYFYARYRINQAIQELPQKLGVEVQQSTEGFTLSKSEGGRTLFTIKASKALQYKKGGHAELKDVSIIVYGRHSDRYDQIYGADFQYDPQTAEVRAPGEVHIDLEAYGEGRMRPDLAPPKELKNPIHLKTSGLVFNHRTGFASTDQYIEFRIPQVSGSAVGATYDAKANVLKLESAVQLNTTGDNPANITAQHGTISKDPRQAVLEVVRLKQGDRTIQADRVTVFLRDDNSIDRVVASGAVQANGGGEEQPRLSAPRAEFVFSGKTNDIKSGVISGGVTVETGGASPTRGTASRVLFDFAAGNILTKVRAVDQVTFHGRTSATESGTDHGTPHQVDLTADGVNFFVSGSRLQRAQTQGKAQFTMAPITPGTDVASNMRTVVTAEWFEALFRGDNRLRLIRASQQARVVASAPGQPDKITTSRDLIVTFAPRGAFRLADIVQQGDFRYEEGTRKAFADKATYAPDAQALTLSGSPRIEEPDFRLTANAMRLLRATNAAVAEGDVKATFSGMEAKPEGSLLAAADPIHVTAARLDYDTRTGLGRFTKKARLWQGANIVEAGVINFDRKARSVTAGAGQGSPVTTVFVQQDKQGRVTPVNVTASRLTYLDSDRKARFEGGVTVKGSDVTLTAAQAEVLLRARGSASAAGPSQLQVIVATGDIVIQQPKRRATGQKLIYTAAEEKFVLTGTRSVLPSIFDAERGTVTGVSLTFFTRDDRVLVEGSSTSRTVTQTQVQR